MGSYKLPLAQIVIQILGFSQYTPLGEIRNTRNLSKDNKSNLQQGDSQHQIKWK